MKKGWAYTSFVTVAAVSTALCMYFSVASFLAGELNMYAYNRELLDSATHAQRDNVLQQAAFLAIRVGGPLLFTTLLWCGAFVVVAIRDRKTEGETGLPNQQSESIHR